MRSQPTMRDCAVCSRPFRVYPSQLKTARYCSRACMAVGRPRPVVERFWAKVARVDDETSCWLWQGKPDQDGYGQMKDGSGNKLRPHRVALEIQLGRPLGVDMQSLHKCDVPLCCRNDGERSHLFEGTARDNIDDMLAKGRSLTGDRNHIRKNPSVVQGERNANARLKADQVREIRRRAADGVPNVSLARQYGVTGSLIGQIVRRTAWRSID